MTLWSAVVSSPRSRTPDRTRVPTGPAGSLLFCRSAGKLCRVIRCPSRARFRYVSIAILPPAAGRGASDGRVRTGIHRFTDR